MAKITRAESNLHDEAMALVNRIPTARFGRIDPMHRNEMLKPDEIEFVFDNYNPMAEHNVGKAAIFFTPREIASGFAMWCAPKGRIIDLCAGIGMLSWAVWSLDNTGYYSELGKYKGDITEIVAVENNPEFVKVGKRLMPWVTWIEGSIFDAELMYSLGVFDCAISNPPYGNIPSAKACNWTKVKGPAQWKVIEVALRMAYNGGEFILPAVDTDYDLINREYRSNKVADTRLRKHWPGVTVMPESDDLSFYDAEWKGANPNVNIVDVNPENVDWNRPYGWEDVLMKQRNMF